MEVEVVLKSPAPTKPKVRVVDLDTFVVLILQQGKEPAVAKALESKPRHVPMADHDPDREVTEEPQRKRKATETVCIFDCAVSFTYHIVLLCNPTNHSNRRQHALNWVTRRLRMRNNVKSSPRELARKWYARLCYI